MPFLIMGNKNYFLQLPQFSKGHNIMLTRLGTEYGWHLPKNREVGAALLRDGKWNYHNSIGLAFTVSKICPKKNGP